MKKLYTATCLSLALSSLSACTEADSGELLSERAACTSLIDEAFVASYIALPGLADEIVANACDYDELSYDLAIQLADATSVDEFQPSDELYALAAANQTLIEPLLDAEYWRGCTNKEWTTAYINLREVFNYSSEEAIAIANAACMAKE
ncbi:hypothetical protein G6O69_13655 [Pseudenhygromyxa sp. WMMC2535]|nr:hypothetical protein [Pseudenhygromyxa sp. WMMC2535]